MALVEASIEGQILSVSADPSGTGVDVIVMGTTVRFVPGITASARKRTIKTPTKELTPAEFLDTTPFPGRSQPGFEGGTVIAEGVFDTDINVLLADFLEVEPAESVLLGALTQNAPGTPRQIRINGVPVVMLTDLRMPSNPDAPANPLFLNQYGFPMKIETALLSPTGPTPPAPPPPTSAEGYFASGEFHAFLFEYGGTGTLLTDPATTPQISMERASYRDEGARIRFEARGFVTTAHSAPGAAQNVELFRVDLNPATGLMEEQPIDRAALDPVEPGYARWRVAFRGNKPGGFRDKAPLLIRVKNHAGPAEAELEPDIREE